MLNTKNKIKLTKMKTRIIKTTIVTLMLFSMPVLPFAMASGESHAGLYNSKSDHTVSEDRSNFGIYSYNIQNPEIDPGDFSSGILRAGGTEGDDSGDPNKVPVGNAWAWLIFCGVMYGLSGRIQIRF